MRKLVVIVAGIAVLALVNIVVVQRERLLESGRVVLLELAPVDPRSLMQGDYMALEFKAARDAQAPVEKANAPDGRLVLSLDSRDVGTFVRRDDGSPVSDKETVLRYRLRDDRVRLVSHAWFFEEGQGEHFARARYGEFRVAPDGEALLAGLRDEKLQRLQPTAGASP